MVQRNEHKYKTLNNTLSEYYYGYLFHISCFKIYFLESYLEPEAQRAVPVSLT